MRVEPCSISLSAEHLGELDRLGSRFAIHLDRHGALTEPDSEIVAFVDLVEAELECRHHGKNVYEADVGSDRSTTSWTLTSELRP